MSIFHYFFGNDKQRAKFVFNFIAPLYGKIDQAIQNDYAKICNQLNTAIPLKGNSVLDIGTGTGGWLASIGKYTQGELVGVDFSTKMIHQAEKNHPGIKFIHSDAENLDSFADNSYDIVTASFVLHGMKAPERAIVVKEMKRIARKYVMIQDFHKHTAPVIQFLEFMERSDYKNFKKNFITEMDTNFKETKLIESASGNAVYVGLL